MVSSNPHLMYIIIIILIVISYIFLEESRQSKYKNIIELLSSSSIILVLIQFIESSNNTQKQNYITYVNDLIINFDNLYLQYPDDFNDLYNEFYNNIQSNTKITNKELIIINIIINNINNLYISNPEFLKEQRVKNKLLKFTGSNKFKTILLQQKNDFSPDFIKLLEEENIIKF